MQNFNGFFLYYKFKSHFGQDSLLRFNLDEIHKIFKKIQTQLFGIRIYFV